MNTQSRKLVDSIARANIAQNAIAQIIGDSARYVSPELRERLHSALMACSDFQSEANFKLNEKNL